MEYTLYIFVAFTQKLKHKKAVNNYAYAAGHISTGRKFNLAQSVPYSLHDATILRTVILPAS